MSCSLGVDVRVSLRGTVVGRLAATQASLLSGHRRSTDDREGKKRRDEKCLGVHLEQEEVFGIGIEIDE